MSTNRILVVDPDERYRAHLRSVLAFDSHLSVVSEATDAHNALKAMRFTRPDLAIVSSSLPGLSGEFVISVIRRTYPWIRVLLLTDVVDFDELQHSVDCGAVAALCRTAAWQTMLEMVNGVMTGHVRFLHWPIADIDATGESEISAAHSDGKEVDLTIRELTVYDCLLIGMSTRESARALGVTEVTIRKIISSMVRKLGAGNRIGAINLAMANGWCSLGTPEHQLESISLPVAKTTGADDTRIDPPRLLHAVSSKRGVRSRTRPLELSAS